jgi:hypothetical protein
MGSVLNVRIKGDRRVSCALSAALQDEDGHVNVRRLNICGKLQ